ncbi:MAG: Eco57I restriction-modification methylase domain-containing protein [Candidatus Hodarchaeota archaeon]
MILSVSQLQSKWDKEKEYYKSQEVGSGVQKFIKDVLKCPDIFCLNEGRLSTPLEKRKNEFIEEFKTLGKRKVDIAIFLSSEIIIPIEVEQYTNIEKGEKQLFQYQEDLDKKYGILTDGFYWRFYNNNIYRLFNLDQLFQETRTFIEFWKEYIKPENYYLSLFEEKGQLLLFEAKLYVEEYKEFFFKDITNLISSLKEKLKIEGYFEGVEKKEKEKKAIEITYAYIIQFILYKTLVDNEFGEFKKEFSEIQKGIYECLKVNQFGKILGIIKGISDRISKNIYRPFAEEQDFITNKLLELFTKPKNELHEVSPWLDIFVFIKKYNFINVKNEIFGFIYENYLKELYQDKKKGQYFTDPAIVDLILDEISYVPKTINNRLGNDKHKKYVSIIDPSCGSGTFLYSAVNRIMNTFFDYSKDSSKKIEELINENIFGLDIEEFPLYLAEMSMLMRMLTIIVSEKYNNPVDKKIKVFKTKDSISEFMDTALKYTSVEIREAFAESYGQPLLFDKIDLGYVSYVRDEEDLKELKSSLENRPSFPRRRFDFVVGNPPYISYNECAKSNLLCIKLIKDKEIKMSDIYGFNLNTVPSRIKTYPPKPNLYAFFIALGLALLKEEGKISYIIPQTVLSANDLDVLRYHLSKYTTIEKIITFNGRMFLGRGLRQKRPIPTSSLIFVAKKSIPKSTHSVEVINYFDEEEQEVEKCVANIRNNKNTITKEIKQSDLLENVDNWNYLTKSKETIEFLKTYKGYTDSFDIYRLFENSMPRFNAKFYFDVGFILDKKYYTENKKSGYYGILDFKACKGYSIFEPKLYYPDDNSKIELTRSNQGHVTLSPKYKIVWRIKNPEKFMIIDQPIIFNMGTSSLITSDNKKEMFYILSLLNSPVTRVILEAYLKIQSEKEYLVAILPLKKYIRVPIINKENEHIKKEIIKYTEKLIELERTKLQNLADFSNLLTQKFDCVKIDDNHLILERNNKRNVIKIRDKVEIIKKELSLFLEKSDKDYISLEELKSLYIVDLKSQDEIKSYIDNLVFALYFKINLDSLDFEKADRIAKMCEKSKYYKIMRFSL